MLRPLGAPVRLARVSRFLPEATQIRAKGCSTGITQDHGAMFLMPSLLIVDRKVTDKDMKLALKAGLRIMKGLHSK